MYSIEINYLWPFFSNNAPIIVKLAAIDIGSNAARMQISTVLHNDNLVSFKRVEYVRFPLRLGHDVFNYGALTPESEARTNKLMQAYKLLMELHEVEGYMACATSAMREASNGPEIAKRIEASTGIKIHIIDGQKEAELINNVVVQALDDRQYLHIDVGGGSTELNVYVNRQKINSKSFKIGSVRLLEGKESKGAWRKIEDWVQDNIDSTQEVTAVGTGGNISKLFNLAAKVSETETNRAEIERIRNYIAGFSQEDRINKLRLNADRADVIVPAADIYISVMKWAGAEKIIVPDLGLKDGIIQLVYGQLNRRKPMW
ncbi:exopolyphosphatase / guanosine-5'-triphosphate,3'-diphosphate pyrophosphatase [Spirosoma endophyticum]|uniref:Exopolyphosphatase / guanosine-5'-triphosphate,3'-diphosphate pyrophosphatase n=1 Tax=Spirosoma endophyticum TaxID=662367 RepID=A0A1I1LWD7_9BACT|nr:exopolyphosphatase / guanosine-5'-triphosphate,3'-diphosphate pyrophosphatase [Spirosoma endophyticum]